MESNEVEKEGSDRKWERGQGLLKLSVEFFKDSSLFSCNHHEMI